MHIPNGATGELKLLLNRLGVFERRVLRRIFGTERELEWAKGLCTRETILRR
jgi:hypothetical protein